MSDKFDMLGGELKQVAVLLASGTGSRFGGDTPKQFVEIHGRMVVDYTLDACLKSKYVDEVIVVVAEDYLSLMQKRITDAAYTKSVSVVVGGDSRKESCIRGVMAIPYEDAKVYIHNAVQPFVSNDTFKACSLALNHYDAVTVGAPSVYTVLEVDGNHILKRIVNRSISYNDLGPECFKLKFLRKVLEEGSRTDCCIEMTNITGIVVKANLGEVYVVPGNPGNIKITYPDDIVLARKIMEERGMV